MTHNHFQLKPANKDELKIAIEWARLEGWNPGLNDLESFFLTDPQGYFIGYLDKEPISFISAVAYDNKFGFIGFYIVKPEYRGKGYGLATWNMALKHLPTQNIGLDGVVDQQENYKKSGFTLAYRNIRYKGKSKIFDSSEFKEVTKINPSDFENILNYDKNCFPSERKNFLKNWLSMPKSNSFKAIMDDQLVGFGMIRKCYNGYKIGPLFADNFQVADNLMKAMQSSLPKESEFYLDAPEPNHWATKLAQQYDMEYVFETARMYTKGSPDINLDKVFGVTSFELG